MTDIIAIMFAKIDDKSFKTDKQEEKFNELSSKLSPYENCIDKSIINEMLHPLPL